MKYIFAVFWFMLGGFAAALIINLRVISANVSDIATPAGLAIYNLHDHVTPYLVFFSAGVVVSFLAFVLLTIIGRLKK